MKLVPSPLRSGLQLLIAAAVSCVATQASTLTYYIDVFSGIAASTTPITPGPGVPVQVPAGGTTVTIQVPQFNTALGTLTQVDFLLNTFSTATATVTNSNPNSSETYSNLNTSMPITVSQMGPPNVSLGTTNTAGVASGSVGAATPTILQIPLSPGFTATVCTSIGGTVDPDGIHCDLPTGGVTPTQQNNTGLSATGTASNSITSALGAFESASPVNVPYQGIVGSISVNGTETSGNGDLQFSGSGQAGAIFEVTYEYIPLNSPEPTTMVLIGSSILGLGLLLRRTRK